MPSGHIAAGNFERPLSNHAWGCLEWAARNPYPVQEINSGVSAKLLRMGYAELRFMPSPYKSHKPGQTVQFIFATDWGRMALDQRRAARGKKNGL